MPTCLSVYLGMYVSDTEILPDGGGYMEILHQHTLYDRGSSAVLMVAFGQGAGGMAVGGQGAVLLSPAGPFICDTVAL